MKTKHKVAIIILTLAVSYTAGYFTGPTKIEEKVKIEYKTTKQEVKTKVVYRDKITKPDGTIVEKEVEKEDSTTKEDSKYENESNKVTTKDVGLVLSVLGTVNLSDIASPKEYSLIVSKRVIGALNVVGGATVSEKSDIKISGGLGWSF